MYRAKMKMHCNDLNGVKRFPLHCLAAMGDAVSSRRHARERGRILQTCRISFTSEKARLSRKRVRDGGERDREGKILANI